MWGKAASEVKARSSFGIHVGKCGRHKAERACSYLGRSRRRAVWQVVTTNCEKSAEAIVPEKKIGTFGEGQNLI